MEAYQAAATGENACRSTTHRPGAPGTIRAWARAGAPLEPLRSIPGAIGALLCILGGVIIAVQFGGGLYLSALGTLILTWVVMWNAFSMMIADYPVPPHQTETPGALAQKSVFAGTRV